MELTVLSYVQMLPCTFPGKEKWKAMEESTGEEDDSDVAQLGILEYHAEITESGCVLEILKQIQILPHRLLCLLIKNTIIQKCSPYF